MELKRVVVTGLGVLTPLGNTVQEFFDNLEAGVSGAELITRFDVSKFKTQFACLVKGFDSEIYDIPKKEARKLDLYTQYALASTFDAIKDSGINTENLDPLRAGVIWGAGIGGIDTFLAEVADFAKGDGTPRFNPFFIPKMIVNIASGHISMKYNLQGPSFTTASACASSTHAMIDALNYIRLGKADVIITGGSEAAVNEAGLGGFNAMKALSTRNDDPKTASRPFDADRDGFVMGEGSVTLIFEELEHAIKRGAKIYAEVGGGAMTSDAHHLTAPHPEGAGAINVMRLSVLDAGLKLEDVDYVNVHGTSTPLGDIAETNAVSTLFGEHSKKLSVSSTKSQTGHLLGAAGAAEAAACIMAITRGVIPPTINHTTPDPGIPQHLDLTLNVAKKREVNVAISNTFGFGGHNACVLLKKYKA